jgi:hypothetical protein
MSSSGTLINRQDHVEDMNNTHNECPTPPCVMRLNGRQGKEQGTVDDSRSPLLSGVDSLLMPSLNGFSSFFPPVLRILCGVA